MSSVFEFASTVPFNEPATQALKLKWHHTSGFRYSGVRRHGLVFSEHTLVTYRPNESKVAGHQPKCDRLV
jgi:hypothetical protein